VADPDNMSRLVCHQQKDVDKLIDKKNLVCLQCRMPYTKYGNLCAHVIGHLGWKRLKCKRCGFSCYERSRMHRHCTNVHGLKLKSETFHRYVIDLKLEGNKLLVKKRRKTAGKRKNESPRNPYEKPKFPTYASLGYSDKSNMSSSSDYVAVDKSNSSPDCMIVNKPNSSSDCAIVDKPNSSSDCAIVDKSNSATEKFCWDL